MIFVNWGLIPYQEALNRQMELVAKVHSEHERDTVIFCNHPPVVTIGRQTEPHEYAGWRGELVKITRGGRATYHGPNQVVVYPIIDLRKGGKKRRPNDVVQFLDLFEQAIARTLKEFSVDAEGAHQSGRGRKATGVWIDQRKITSIGIAIKRWITYHGAAINLDYDPLAFRGITPCGFSPQTMISLEEALGRRVERSKFEGRLELNLENFLG